MKKWNWMLISILVIILDQASKYWVQSALIPYRPMPVMPMLNFTLAFNTGASFSFLSGAGEWHKVFFAGFSLIISTILFIWFWRTDTSYKLQLSGISLILGGAIGNLIDRGIHGHVIDFIDFYYKNHHFATFNIADSAICLGAGILILDALINRD